MAFCPPGGWGSSDMSDLPLRTHNEVKPTHNEVKAKLAGALAGQEDRLLPCVHCGFCLPVCPTYQRLGDENDSPRGRLYLMRAVVEGRLEPDSDAFQDHIDRCLACRACEPVCPSGVEYGSLLELAREVALEARPPRGLLLRMLRVFRSRKKTLRAMAWGRRMRDWGMAGLMEALLPEASTTRFGLSMLNASKPIPLMRIPGRAGSEGDHTTDEGLAARAVLGCREDGTALRVALLTGCVQQGLFARVNDATERVLRANGFEVVPVRSQVCCGSIHAHSGAARDARELAGENVRAFAGVDVDFIAVNAAGCGAAMKEYDRMLEGDPALAEQAEAVGSQVRDLSELLAMAGPRRGAPLQVKVTCDSPCHLEHVQRITQEPLDMLRAIPSLQLVTLPGASECCGGAGIYGVTHPELGAEIGGDKVDAILETGADLVSTPNPGCMMQIGAELRDRRSTIGVVHPVELLDESYRRAGYYE
jgi:glycolate dehydrogenase iron-sulfur subunit